VSAARADEEAQGEAAGARPLRESCECRGRADRGGAGAESRRRPTEWGVWWGGERESPPMCGGRVGGRCWRAPGALRVDILLCTVGGSASIVWWRESL